MKRPSSFITHTVLLALTAGQAHAVGTDDQVNSAIDFGTFQNPSSNIRPRFRYWVNDASHSLSRIAEDVRSLASAGAGGLELLGYYLYGETGSYGGQPDAVLQSDWTVYAFGLEPWSEYILAECAEISTPEYFKWPDSAVRMVALEILPLTLLPQRTSKTQSWQQQ